MIETIRENRQGIAWVMLWAWIALTIFILAYGGNKPAKIYIINVLLMVGFVYLMFFWE